MLLSELLKRTEHTLLGNDTEVNALQYNSRKVGEGDVFFCVVGTFADGHIYAEQAVAAGARVLVVERELPLNVTQVLVKNTRIAMAEMAAAYYDYPTEGLEIAGITGTSGKTSTTYMLKAIAEAAGKKVGLIGTIRNLIGDTAVDSDRTTPESVDLQALFHRMREEQVGLVVMEVSSHSLDQHRVHGVHFDVGVFTNLSQDHLDYHKNFESYLDAKKLLFLQSKHAIVNADDSHSATMLEGLSVSNSSFGITERADVSASEIDITTRGVQFDMATRIGKARINIPTPGLFSVYNAMGASAAAIELGFTLDTIKRGLERMGVVSGRLEPLESEGRDFTVFLDYAHKPDALENVLKTVRGFAKGRIVTLFGCGGDRDKAKRPLMGEVAGRYSDFIVLTSDNPRSEEPLSIIAAIEDGVKKTGAEYVIIENRYAAIEYALHNAHKDDVIILAGKGHESYQEINGGKHHFDEKEIVAEILSR